LVCVSFYLLLLLCSCSRFFTVVGLSARPNCKSLHRSTGSSFSRIIPIIRLQLSGVGPKALMDSLSITSVVDLPGVGQNLQDHGMFSFPIEMALAHAMIGSTSVSWAVDGATWWDLMTNDTLQAAALSEWRDDSTGLWTYINEAVGT
jgi:hypothetical protein